MPAANFFRRAASKVRHEYRDFKTLAKVRASLQRVAGPSFIELPEGEVVVILLGRNMEHYLDYFYEYHRMLGANYFIYCDNGSTDRTLEIVSKWPNAIVLETHLDFRDFQIPIRREISSRYCSNGWRLAIDPDELFDYVGSEKFSLQELARRLRGSGHTGLVAQMLDMVPDDDLATSSRRSFEQSVIASKYFSLEQIDNFSYYDDRVPFAGLVYDNTLPDVNIEWKFGGLRRQYFGENCCLTKHALFYLDCDVKAFVHPHLTRGLRLADFTALLRHYKFSGDFLPREAERISNNRISHGETEQRSSIIGGDGGFRFDVSKMQSNSAPRFLVDQGFLVMSEEACKAYT